MSDPEFLDCLVIGGGPAGLTAALYLRRFHRHVLVCDAGHSRAAWIPRTHNYPGFPDGIVGTELLARLREQVTQHGGEVRPVTVTGLQRLEGGGFEADLDGRPQRTRTVLLATGVVDRAPPVPGSEALRQQGLMRQCPICDGYEYTDRRVGVIGGGAHGAREALFISNFTSDLTLVIHSDPDEVDEALHAELAARGVRILPGPVLELCALPGSRVLMRRDGGSEESYDVVYSALGTRVRSNLALGLGAAADDQGCLQVDDHLQTQIEGLYAAGDVVASLSQLAVATGQAAIAATAIHNRLPRRRPGGGG
ncbi:NAD(P)/FAD-dependent oxidoreductase [Caldimonas tepidiphila]|uniref:NAD(P)/FAD-dependent oxidoreductase n=1 Tax=Caldimonas tepidiphila TaxID=2315841 RepID=UPI00196A36BB|nr:NAD(P)/FAD-dependent oxidoreductase [Caldimonas tepidiphila]